MQEDQESNISEVQTTSYGVEKKGLHIPPHLLGICISIPESSRQQDKAEGTCEADEKKINFTFSCMKCNSDFDSREKLASHTCPEKETPTDVLYECNECKMLYPSLDALAKHMKQHDQHVVVLSTTSDASADQSQKVVNAIDLHYNLQSLGAKPSSYSSLGYQCDVCDKFLCSKGSLVKHQQLHQGLKPYSCHFCDKAFSLKGNRDKHELIHSGEKSHQCGICEKTFTLKGNLQQHILTHTSLKMFKCPICGSDFTLKGNLSKHMKRHENGLGLSGKRLNEKTKEKTKKMKTVKLKEKAVSNENELAHSLKKVDEKLKEMVKETSEETDRTENIDDENGHIYEVENDTETEKINEGNNDDHVNVNLKEIEKKTMKVDTEENIDNNNADGDTDKSDGKKELEES